ncbi:MAG TPA: DUF2259 domain-containing protein [Alphaproteobacteria bacterium]|nr:DUF2259 domain-containing protein [Alphaproteobacteria bacterium]
MRPNVVTRGTVRLAASLALAPLAAPALAGDRAGIGYLGYSEDGRYFAFEEFGVQDGSGFPYANIYVVDLPADRWVSGTPFRVTLDDEDADVEDARDAAREQAAARLDELAIVEAADPIAVNGDGEPGAAGGNELVFGRPGYGLEPVDAATIRTLALDVFPLEPAADCAVIDNEVFGFALRLDGTEVHRDAGPLPRSRGCAQGYRIHAVVRPAGWSQAPGGTVAIIATYPFGFEGPDRRFLAVPLPD